MKRSSLPYGKPLESRHVVRRLCVTVGFLAALIAHDTTTVSAQTSGGLTGDPQDLKHPHADSCAWTGGSCEWDYNMQAMKAEFEAGLSETFFAYQEPDVANYYNQSEGQLTVMEPSFTGMFAKFVNLSPKAMQVHW